MQLFRKSRNLSVKGLWRPHDDPPRPTTRLSPDRAVRAGYAAGAGRDARRRVGGAAMIEAGHPEAVCEDCGGHNVSWYSPNALWNKIVRRADKGDPMLCPRCFILRAEAMGISEVWEVSPRP